MGKLKVLELFGGIGAPRKALQRLGIEHEVVDYVEIDKFAVKSYNAIFNENYEPQDILTWDKDLKVDMIFHGSPCQDFSLAGKQAGGDKDSGTRSSLLYETVRIVSKLKPKYVIWENVKNVISKKHKHTFDNYLHEMELLGYTNYYQVLNAKNYGIPQNRERVFTVSILKEKTIYDDYNSSVRKDQDTIGTLTCNCGSGAIRNGWKIIESEQNFTFPPKQELTLKLKDMLEDEVDEKYYLSDEILNKIKHKFNNEENVLLGGMQEHQSIKKGGICATLTSSMGTGGGFVPMVSRKCGIFDTEKSKHQAGSVYDENGLAPTLDTMQGGWRQPCIEIKNATKKGYKKAYDGDSVNLAYPESETRRGRVEEQVAQTLQCNDNMEVVEIPRIRKLTPKECWRLMGFDDEDFDKASKVNSNTQLYKQAGNSIVVNVLVAIFKEW